MGLAQYAIVPIRNAWGVLHDGEIAAEYATKEAAFESAVAAASLAMRLAGPALSYCSQDASSQRCR